MKTFLRLLLVASLLCGTAAAQEVKVESFVFDPTDLSAVSGEVVDLNGKACALLKIMILDKSVSFKSDWIIKTEDKGQHEYWVWLCEGTSSIIIKSDYFIPFEVFFANYNPDVRGLKSKCTYILVINSEKADSIEYETTDLQYKKGLYYDSIGLYQDAMRLYKKAAEQGYAPAQYRLGRMYSYGNGVAKDYGEAIKWYKKAAEQGYAMAQNNYGVMYETGHGVTRNIVEAKKWYRASAEQGCLKAQCNLGKSYLNEERYGEAFEWFSKAAAQGDLEAQNNLGVLYNDGKGVKQDYDEAVKWYRIAAENGHPASQYNLGRMYYLGKGVEKNIVEAVKWFRLAAQQGQIEAEYVLKLMGY